MLYIRLFHGRTDLNQDMDDWGSDGPVFGPYEFVHITYSTHVKLGKPDDDCDELFAFEDLLFYDGIYYGDWSVFVKTTLEKTGFKVVTFEQSKADIPKTSNS